MSFSFKVKICGICRSADAKAAVCFGADVLGFNFYPQSPRYVEAEKAKELGDLVDASVWRVGLFVNMPRDQILKTVETAGLDTVQLHGDETAEDVQRLGAIRVIKAVRLRSEDDVERCVEFADIADFLLVDAFHPTLYGGGGNQIDSELLSAFGSKDIWSKTFLAGGLTAQNVAEQVSHYKPFGVDVASGVESAPGEKSVELMSKFIQAAKGL